MQVSSEIGAPPEWVWDYMSRPEFASTLLGGNRIEIAQRRAGQIAEGSQYLCYHGDAVIQNTILDWQPFERLVFQFVMPVPINGVTAMVETTLTPTNSGTRMIQTYSKSRGPLVGRLMSDHGLKSMRGGFVAHLDEFKAQIEADYRARAGSGGGVEKLTVDEIVAAAREALQPA